MNELDDFERLLRENGPFIYSLALRLCRNVSDGEDLAQDTFIKAYEKRDQFRADASVKTWLFRICVNVWKNRVRYERRRFFWRHLSLGFRGRDGEEPEFDVAASDQETDVVLERADTQKLLQNALEKLEAHERAILVLCDVQGQSYEEIAGLLEIPMGTVRSRLARARDRLRQLFTDEPVVKKEA
jgi:RNA polymerase sigma-70 factor (ECF subfamily)